MSPKTKKLLDKLRQINDPELGVNIVDLGFIYELKWNREGEVAVVMTLTTPGCPLARWLKHEVERTLADEDGVREIRVEFTFDPPWDEAMMTESARRQLGLE